MRAPAMTALLAGVLALSGRPAEGGPPGRERAERLLAAARTETDLGDYDRARGHAEEAARIFRERGETADAGKAFNVSGLASIYAGDYARAERSLDEAVAASTAAGDAEGLAEELGNRGNVDFFRGRYADAAERYERALAVASASRGDWVERRRRILRANQAILHQRLGRYEQALGIYRGLAGAAEALAPAERAQLLVNEGALFRRLGDPVKALESYDEALRLFRLDRNVDGELGALKNRGIALSQDLGRAAEGISAFSTALAAATRAGNRREMLQARLHRAEALLRTRDAAAARADFAAALELARELETPEEEWKALYGLGRTEPARASMNGRFGEAVAIIERMRGELRVPSFRPDFLHDKRDVYDALIAGQADEAPPSVVFDLIERARSRDWRDRLRLPAAVDLAGVQAALPADALLLDYWISSAGSKVVLATRARAAVVRLDVDAEEVARYASALAAGPAPDRNPDPAALSRLLPSAPWFEGVKHVVIVPDGVTSLVPFETLLVGDARLIARAAVSYLPTAAALLRPPHANGDWRWPWEVEVEAFGDPVFAASALDDAAELRRRLPATRDEIARIAEQMTGRVAAHVGPENRKAYLLERRPRPPILHLATHAAADSSALEQSRILFSPPAGRSAADYLFLREAYDLPLEGVELAVLSACQTERGPYVRGEGVLSFSRALLAAGAWSTVTTLWRVADAPTADFMAGFYFQLGRGVAKDEALRRAKLRFIRSGTRLADPHYWGAFVLTGDAGRPLPRTVSWRLLVLGVLLPAGAIGGGLLAGRRRARRPTTEPESARPPEVPSGHPGAESIGPPAALSGGRGRRPRSNVGVKR